METGSHFDIANIQFGDETKKYLALIEESTGKAKAYDGSEEAYNSLMASLENLEDTVTNFPSLQTVPKQDRDLAAALKFAPDNPLDIKQLLEIAITARLTSLRESLNNIDNEDREVHDEDITKPQTKRYERIKNSSFFVIHVNGVLLPPDKDFTVIPSNGSEKFEAARFEDRINDLLSIFDKLGIYSDDLITMIGKEKQNAMRKESYAAIRIPRINRSILICNQVGEATFVIRGDISTKELLSNSKDGLQKKLGNEIKKVIRATKSDWETKIYDLLASDSAWTGLEKHTPSKPVGPKIDVRQFSVEELKNRIIDHFKTPEIFVKTSYIQRKDLEVDGRKATSLSTKIGYRGDVTGTTADWLEFGLKLWPGNKLITQNLEYEKRKINDKKITLDDWLNDIRKAYTPETFINQPTTNYNKLLNGRISALSLAKLIGIDFSDYSHVTKHKLLLTALKIWPDNKMLEKELEIETRPLDEWRRLIKLQFTPEKWISMSTNEKYSFRIDDNFRMRHIASIFKVDTQYIFQQENFLELGLRIWPNNELIKNAKEAFERKSKSISYVEIASEQEILETLRSKYSPEQWLKINRRQFDFKGLSINYLAKKFGIKEQPEYDTGFFKLSLKIYPLNQIFIDKLKEAEERVEKLKNRSLDEWRQVILGQITPEQWVTYTIKKRRRMEFDGIKLTALSSIFGNKGNVLENTDLFLKLGLTIWPGNELIQKKFDELNLK